MKPGGGPVVESKRLVLRRLEPSDAARVRELANHPGIASVTTNIPHPYPEGLAEGWIETHDALWTAGKAVHFGIRRRSDGLLVGVIGLEGMDGTRGTVGYWLGFDFWSRGYATEACRALVAWAGRETDLKELQALHMLRNPASGRVLQKSGFHFVGEKVAELGGRAERVAEYRCGLDDCRLTGDRKMS